LETVAIPGKCCLEEVVQGAFTDPARATGMVLLLEKCSSW
jgi:hypothetical protein